MDLPRKLGPYRLLRRLGSGGMAEVFLAQAYGASGFEKHVAIKAVLPELQGEGTYERLLIEEARLGARLAHPHLVGIHDLGVDDGAYYVRLDWVDGADLRALLAKAHLPLDAALAVGEAIARGLSCLHGATDESGRPLGLVHRDVSPSNVLLSRSGEIKLADFGIAKATLLADVHRSQARKGKLGYMSPEQARDDTLTARSDQFSLASTLYEALTGRPAFEGTSPVDTLTRIELVQIPALDELPAAVGEILRRAWARKPEERWPDCLELAKAIRAVRPPAEVDRGGWVRESLANLSPPPPGEGRG